MAEPVHMVMPNVKSIGALPTAHPAADPSRGAQATAVVVVDRRPPRRAFAELVTPRPLTFAGEDRVG